MLPQTLIDSILVAIADKYPTITAQISESMWSDSVLLRVTHHNKVRFLRLHDGLATFNEADVIEMVLEEVAYGNPTG